MNRVPVIFDSDFGVDEAAALAILAKTEGLDLRALTTVFGIRPVRQATENALKLLTLTGREDIPVAAGAAKPILSTLKVPSKLSHAHGTDGLAGNGGRISKASKQPENIGAVQLMERTVVESEQNVVIMASGPLTNVATFLLAHPELHGKLDGIVMSVGAIFGGDALPSVEFNAAQDPEAAHIVFSSGVRLLMCGLDVTRKAYLSYGEIEALPSEGAAGFIKRCISSFADGFETHEYASGCPLAAALPAAWLAQPEVLSTEAFHVEIDLDGRYSRGCTATDTMERLKRPKNAAVAVKLTRERFRDTLAGALLRLVEEEKK